MSMIRSGRDRQTIAIDDPDECLFWCSQFGVAPEQLRAAVAAAGPRADAVRDHIERHCVVPVRENTAGG